MNKVNLALIVFILIYFINQSIFTDSTLSTTRFYPRYYILYLQSQPLFSIIYCVYNHSLCFQPHIIFIITAFVFNHTLCLQSQPLFSIIYYIYSHSFCFQPHTVSIVTIFIFNHILYLQTQPLFSTIYYFLFSIIYYLLSLPTHLSLSIVTFFVLLFLPSLFRADYFNR